MSSFLDEIKHKLKEGRTELKIISGGGPTEKPSVSSKVGLYCCCGFICLAIIIVVVVLYVSHAKDCDNNPNLIQLEKKKEDPEEIIKDLSDAADRIQKKEKENKQEYRDPNFTLLKDLVDI